MKALTISVFIVVPLLAMDGPSVKVVSKTEENRPAQINPNQQEFAKLVITYTRHGEIGQIDKLGKAGVNFNVLDHDGQGPVHFATKLCSARALRALLNNKANINFLDDAGCSPLHHFCKLASSEHGWIKLKELFAKFKAKNGIRTEFELDPNVQNNQGRTPLHVACESVNLEAVQFLRSLKARLNIRDNNKQYAIELTENREIMKGLILAGAIVPDSVKKRAKQKKELLLFDLGVEVKKLRVKCIQDIEECNQDEKFLNRCMEARKTKNDTLRKAKTQLSPRSCSSVAELQQLFEPPEPKKEG